MSREGFWTVEFQGIAGAGAGMVVLDTGQLVGADASGMHYDGNYTADPASGDLDCVVRCTVTRPGTWLVQSGRPVPVGAAFEARFRLPRTLGEARPVQIQTSAGPVVAVFTKLRDFPN
jgi:hypothetical protein